jgi:redox-sensitive bicupin YhaK (pirin superfamily)
MLLVAGAPIGEPVARRGPFVMNTEEEIRQAIEDYQSGRLVGG